MSTYSGSQYIAGLCCYHLKQTIDPTKTSSLLTRPLVWKIALIVEGKTTPGMQELVCTLMGNSDALPLQESTLWRPYFHH
jgi:hypothetical protein